MRNIRPKAIQFPTVLCFVLLLLCSPSEAHQDTPLRLRFDGSISGLPGTYRPATLTLTRDHLDVIRAAVLKLGDGEYRFPECLVRALEGVKKDNVRLLGSWYHDLNVLPPYLVIEFRKTAESKNPAWALFSGYSLLFNLRTAELLKVREHVWFPGDGGMAEVPAFVKLCGGTEPQVRPKK